MKCPLCQTELIQKVIGPKKRSACPKCSYLVYESINNGHYNTYIEKIIDGLIKTGQFEAELTTLGNLAFRQGYGGHTTEEQVAEWCALHDFAFKKTQKKNSLGHPVPAILFTRKMAPVVAATSPVPP